jgi:hypothetical protein
LRGLVVVTREVLVRVTGCSAHDAIPSQAFACLMLTEDFVCFSGLLVRPIDAGVGPIERMTRLAE